MCIYHNSVSVVNRMHERKSVIAKCGHCIECLKERQNSWKLRMVKEAQYWNHVYFFTLTFNDDNLPCVVVARDEYDSVYFSGTLPQCLSYVSKRGLSCDVEASMKGYEIDNLMNVGVYSDFAIKSTADNKQVSNFIKRVRMQFTRQYGRKLVMKYFIASEYGPSAEGTRRPHYHGILFCNEDYFTLAPFFSKWESIGRYEFVESRPVDSDTRENSHSKIANYVSKYCAKGSFDSRQDDTRCKHIQKARFSCSNGIGSRWLEERKDDWLKYIPTCLYFDSKFSWLCFDDVIVERYFKTGVLCFSHAGVYYPLNVDSFGNVDTHSYEYEILSKLKSEVENLCDNLLVYDGDFGYKMPRFMYDRLFLRKIVCEREALTKSVDFSAYSLRSFFQPVRNPWLGIVDGYKVEYFIAPPHHVVRGTFLNPTYYDIPKKIATHKVTRYVSESFISNAIVYCLRERSKTLHDREVQRLESSLFHDATSDAHLEVSIRKEASRLLRAQESESKLHDFYFRNSLAHPEFDV